MAYEEYDNREDKKQELEDIDFNSDGVPLILVDIMHQLQVLIHSPHLQTGQETVTVSIKDLVTIFAKIYKAIEMGTGDYRELLEVANRHKDLDAEQRLEAVIEYADAHIADGT